MKYASSLGGVAVALLGLAGSLFGQAPASLPGPSAEGPLLAALRVSDWIAYPRSPSCCGNVGAHGPILGEGYFRAGVSVPLGTNSVATDMNVGFTSSFGARSLFFNTSLDNAWVVDFGLRNTWWSITDAETFILQNQLLPRDPRNNNVNAPLRTGPQAHVPRRLHAMTADLSFGQECYLMGNAACDGAPKWRAGWDLGGSYGSARMDFRILRHRTDTVGGYFSAVHSDYECPFGWCTMNVGARVEYGCTFNDLLLRYNDSNVHAVSATVTLGLRF